MFPDVNGPTNAGFERGQKGTGGQRSCSVAMILTMRERITSFRPSVSLGPLLVYCFGGWPTWEVSYDTWYSYIQQRTLMKSVNMRILFLTFSQLGLGF